jgi:hypothetical protein
MTKTEAIQALQSLSQFIGKSQREAIAYGLRGEESQFFCDMIAELVDRIQNMPESYQQDGKGRDATVYLHYFRDACDWYIIEKDIEPEQVQAFGWANLGDDENAEFGYIWIAELLECGVELDLYWDPKPLWQAIKR